MEDNVKQYIDQWFVNPTLKTCGYSFYAIRKSLKEAIDELKTQISGSVLDIGCGVMPYKEYLKGNSKVTSYIGVDLKPTEYHNMVMPDIFWDGKKIPFEDSTFDWVIATEFLEHYDDTLSVLKEINRVLKNGGVLFFTVPFIWPLHESPYDLYRPTPFYLEKRFKEAKFDKITIKPLGGYYRAMAIMLGLWYENGANRLNQISTWFVVRLLYIFLIKKKEKNFVLGNNTFPSGLYGFITKGEI
jgi:SAM-dependent methyltransferase